MTQAGTTVINPSFTVSDSTICRNAPITLTNTSTVTGGTIASYEWVRTIGLSLPFTFDTARDGFYSPTEIGTHIITLIMTAADGVTEEAQAIITVADVAASIASLPATATVGQSLTLNGASSTAQHCTVDAWTWYVSINGAFETLIGTGQNRTYTPTAPGTYEFILDAACTSHDCHSQQTALVTVT